jgi:FkbM family methyltransferase
MNDSLRKLIRTVQSHFYFLKEAKDAFYYHSRRLLSQPHETEFHALRFIPDDLPGCYIDVGANHGQSIESIRTIKPNARIYSFEANGFLVEKLQARYHQRQDVTVFPYGLADEDQSRTLFIPVYRKFVYDGGASFDRQSAVTYLGPDLVYWFSPAKFELKETGCTLRRLDSQHLEPVFIKIDVQGYEYHVIKGGIETIKHHEPILMLEAFHGNGDLVRLVGELGYEEYLFDETGFYRANSRNVLNSILMTPQRARTVRLSERNAQIRRPIS